MMTVVALFDQSDHLRTGDNVEDVLSRVLAMFSRADSKADACDDDTRNIAASLNGDSEAFGRLVEKYQATIAAQMQRFSRDQAIVEELVHDTFVEAYFSLKSYRSRSPLIHWLRKIAVRVGYRYWKRQSRERQSTVLFSEIEGGVERLASGPTTEASEASEMLGDLLQLLSPRDRLVLTLLYWDGCSVAEAAERTGWSRSMVKVQAHRARKRLRKLIEDSMK